MEFPRRVEGEGKNNKGLSSKANCQLRGRLAEGKIIAFSIVYVSFISISKEVPVEVYASFSEIFHV